MGVDVHFGFSGPNSIVQAEARNPDESDYDVAAINERCWSTRHISNKSRKLKMVMD